MAEEQMNLVQKLAKIRAISDVVSKEKRGYNYTYADITTILAKITAGMKKYGVSLIPQIVPGTSHVEQNVVTNTKFDKTGKAYDNTTTEMLVTADMVFRWINDENPDEFIEVPWFVTGSQSDPSQAWDMLNYVAASGVIYFAFTTKINVCKDKHAFIGTKTCPKCGGEVEDQYARVVGFYTPVSGYQNIRKQEFSKRRWYDVLSKDGVM